MQKDASDQPPIRACIRIKIYSSGTTLGRRLLSMAT